MVTMLNLLTVSVWQQFAANAEPLCKAVKQFLSLFKSGCNKRRKTDQDCVCLSFILLLLKFIRKENFPLKCKDFSVSLKCIIVAIKLLFSVYPFWRQMITKLEHLLLFFPFANICTNDMIKWLKIQCFC